jgi:NADPH:quinone reductase-like Zn-dependent oxidoreductase
MRAVVYSETGGPEVLRLVERPSRSRDRVRLA